MCEEKGRRGRDEVRMLEGGEMWIGRERVEEGGCEVRREDGDEKKRKGKRQKGKANARDIGKKQ